MGTGEVKWRPDLGDVAGVCRVLFDEPLQQEESRRFARAELEKFQTTFSHTWNYDFVNDAPLEGRYEWTRVSNSDPEEYAASRKDSAISCSPLHLKARENAVPSLHAEKQPKLTGGVQIALTAELFTSSNGGHPSSTSKTTCTDYY
ncbi:cyclin-dependent kinase inhibitor 1B-like [Ornithodoros turicata]|uniref:cyclin-dependent kinase inhibitor 1B-like n=1 Tax=Ornithodoros turicata TaxID=34597 RepID=UPI0031393A57